MPPAPLSPPAEDEILVVVVALPLAHAFVLPDPILSPDENQRAARFVFPVDRARYVASHRVLHHVLGVCLGRAPGTVAFAARAPGEKPRLQPPDTLEFNLSQAGACAMVAVARARAVGVDVEVQDSIDGTPIERELAPVERAGLAARAEPERRAAKCRLWVRKEAYLKARGVGLVGGLADFEVALDDPPTLLASHMAIDDADVDARARWCLVALPAPAGYEAALAHAAPQARVVVRELPWSAIET